MQNLEHFLKKLTNGIEQDAQKTARLSCRPFGRKSNQQTWNMTILVHYSRNSISSKKPIPAGDFSSWLCQARDSLLGNEGMEVACEACVGCCSSSYFIHISPEEKETIRRIPANVIFAAPGQPKGHLLMGYDRDGLCPMLKGTNCAIYEHRPQTCRDYDCRVFAAAGIAAGGDEKAVINERVERWLFSYPTKLDCNEHQAVKAAAKFIREHACHFPGGRVPDNPSQLAVLAIKSYEVFIGLNGIENSKDESLCVKLAETIVEACKKFDNSMELNEKAPNHSLRDTQKTARPSS
jgi:Fe-S-cluster containining protein